MKLYLLITALLIGTGGFLLSGCATEDSEVDVHEGADILNADILNKVDVSSDNITGDFIGDQAASDQTDDFIDETVKPEAWVPPCPEDDFSPNQTQETAWQLDSMTGWGGLTVCPYDPDWYVFDMEHGYEMQFSVCWPIDGEPVELEFFRAEFPQPEHYLSGGGSSGESMCVNTTVWQAAGTYYFKVSNAVGTKADKAEYEYKLYWKSWYYEGCPKEEIPCDSSTTCTDGHCVCNTDTLEPNDTAAAAASIEFNQLYELTGCIEDDDWLTVEAEAGDVLKIQMETSGVVGNGYFFSLGVFDAAAPEEPLEEFPKYLATQDFTFTVPETGAYLLRVKNIFTHGRNYSINVTK